MSKNIRLPPKVQLQEISNQTGSYPTVARTGDSSRLGMTRVKFDDRKTVVFNQVTSINLPSCVDSTLIDGGLAYITSSISAPGVSRKGIADEFVSFVDNVEPLVPFNDSLVEFGYRDDPFYSTGSKIDVVGPGFTNRLFSKTAIHVDLTPSVAYSASIQNGATNDTTNPITEYTTGIPDGGQIYAAIIR